MKPIRDCSKSELEAAIDEWIVMHRNAQRNRELLKKHMIDGVSFEALAEEYGMSVRGVQYAIYRCQEILFRHL
jgi:predicted DNA-binding protein YlxM (UPF0122 family)